MPEISGAVFRRISDQDDAICGTEPGAMPAPRENLSWQSGGLPYPGLCVRL